MDQTTQGLPAASPPAAEINVSREVINLLYAVKRRRKLVILMLALGAALGGLYYATATRIYESQASILVMQNQALVREEKTPTESIDKLIETYRSMVASDAVLIEALKALPPEARAEFSSADPAKQTELLRRNLRVTAQRRTTILDIAYRSKSPQAAAMVVDGVLSAYLHFMDNLHKTTAGEALRLLTSEKDKLDNELNAKQQRFLALQAEMRDPVIVEGDRPISVAAKRLLAMGDEVLKTGNARQEAEAIQQSLRAAIDRGEDLRPFVPVVMGATGQEVLRAELESVDRYTVARIQEDLLRDRVELQSIGQHCGPAHSKWREMAERVRVKEEFLRNPTGGALLGMNPRDLALILWNMAWTRYQTAAAQEILQIEAYEREKTTAKGVQGELAQLDVLSHDLDRMRKYYDSLVTRIKDVDLTKQDGMLKTAVLSTPEIPVVPVRPSLPMVLMLSLLGGIGSGLALVYFVEMLDDRFGSIEQMRLQLGGLPVLAMIRKLQSLDAVGAEAIHVHAQPSSADTECFRTLRTALAFVGDGARSVVVTSSEPGDGKTTVITNLATAVAQSSKRTLLIDADIRRPKLTPMLGLRGPQGLSTVLRHESRPEQILEEHIQTSVLPDLDVLPSGPRAADAAELLATERFSEILSWAEARYDYIFIDSPPAFVSDATIIGRLADGMILVVRPEKNQRRTVVRTVESLGTMGVKLLGLVVNHFAFEDSKYYGYEYGYGYGYGYSYHYGYGHDEETADASPAAPEPSEERAFEEDFSAPRIAITRRAA